MEKIERYQNLIVEILEEYAAVKPANMVEYENQVLVDYEHNHYQLLTTGWNKKGQFIHLINFHFDIKPTGKIWLMANNTDVLIAQELVKKGVPKEDIVLGFQPPSLRPQTDYAIA